MPEKDSDFHGDDLEWAQALATGDSDALARYEREIVPFISSHLRRRGVTDETIDELQQTLRVRLLVDRGADRGPAICRYQGRGRLRSWVLVTALRETIRLAHQGKREAPLDQDELMVIVDGAAFAGAGMVEKGPYREAFRSAFRRALDSLQPRDRNLLRMHALDGLSIDQLGRAHGVHRATAARWLERARDSVSRCVRRELMQKLDVSPFELDELLGWIQSRIDVSLGGLADTSPDE